MSKALRWSRELLPLFLYTPRPNWFSSKYDAFDRELPFFPFVTCASSYMCTCQPYFLNQTATLSWTNGFGTSDIGTFLEIEEKKFPFPVILRNNCEVFVASVSSSIFVFQPRKFLFLQNATWISRRKYTFLTCTKSISYRDLMLFDIYSSFLAKSRHAMHTPLQKSQGVSSYASFPSSPTMQCNAVYYPCSKEKMVKYHLGSQNIVSML